MTSMMRLGRCLNAGRCGLAGQRGPIPVDPGAPFRCPECKSELIPFEGRPRNVEPGKKLPKTPRMLILPALLLAVLIVIGIWFDLFRGFDPEDMPPVDAGLAAPYAPAGNVRTGTSAVTYDALAPSVWRAFLTDQGCTSVTASTTAGKTRIGCADGPSTTIIISAPNSAIGIAGTAMKTFDVLLTTDQRYADAPGSTGKATPAEDGSVTHADVIGIDALAVIVHPDNPLARLSQPQLAAIFLGRVADFADVGGRPGGIGVIAPAGDARATDRLDAIVPQWLPLTPSARRLPTSAAIVDAVLADRQAIGIVDRRDIGAARALAIGPASGLAVAPTPLALVSGDYPLARPVRAVRFNRDDSPFETAFLAFLATPPGQAAIAAAGFEPLRRVRAAAGPPASAPAAYRALVAGSARVAADLRFRGDGLDFTPRTDTDLAAVAARLAGERIAADRIVVIGLSDPGRPDAAADSARLAARIATALGERGLQPGLKRGLGAILPIAEGPGSASRNRRVEIWIRPA